LIDEAGLKGRRVGGAQVSEKHANFIVNTGGAKAGDVAALIELVREEVWRRFSVRLELEVKVVT
jgi:UDP-N-acetylmuramate dehydrogenase